MVTRMTIRLIAILFGCICLASVTHTTHAFADLGELNAIAEYFLDVFNAHGGRDFLERLERGEAIDRQDFEELDAIFGIPCLLGSIRFNRFGKEAAALKCYDEISVCLSDGQGFPECPEDNSELIEFTDELDAAGKEFRFANNEGSLPPNLQGVFWLNYGGAPASSIMSFAQTRDGGDLSTGIFESDKENISYRIRVAGDRNWAFENNSVTNAYGYVKTFDFIYEFRVTEGSDEDPTRITIYFSFIIPFFPMFRFHMRECYEWSFKWEMILLTDDSAKGNYTDSVYWARNTTTILTGKNDAAFYPLLQVINASGVKIERAYADFLGDQSKPSTSGNRPNENFFRALDGDSSSTTACLKQL